MALVGVAQAFAQVADSSNSVVILINNADRSTSVTGASNFTRLIGNVDLRQGGNQMFCDSALLDLQSNNVEAFGSVRIIQPGGTMVESDYLRYTGNTRQAYLRGNVHLTDGKNSLWSEELNYNTGTKIGTYTQGGTLQSESTTLSSNAGNYNVRTKESRFTGDVIVTDPRYNVVSEDLGYNTGTKLVTFYNASIVTNDRSELRTTRGTYDSNKEIGRFTSRSSIRNEAQYVEGDSLDYNRVTGFGIAVGNVIALDTAQRMTLYAGRAAYNEKTRTMLATIRPVLRKQGERDSLFMRADTFFSAPTTWLERRDSLQQKIAEDTTRRGVPRAPTPNAPATRPSTPRPSGKPGRAFNQVVVEADPTPPAPTQAQSEADSTAPRFFTGYRHVIIWSDSLQGRCDSIFYSQQDSVIRMMRDPVAWSRASQITGDTILLHTDSSHIRLLYVPANALVVSEGGPPSAGMYDQVQGRTLTGYFENNELRHLVVVPEAESIYYARDDDGRYLGVNQSSADQMDVFLKDEAISRILLKRGVKQTMLPMKEANFNALRLSRFQWRSDSRPRSRTEIFE